MLARKLLNRIGIEEEYSAAASVCDNQVLDRSQIVESKDGEMSEWLKEHAWKAKRASATQ